MAARVGDSRGSGAEGVAQSPWPARYLGLVMFFCLALLAVPFWWGLPSWNSWAFDEIEPEHVAEKHGWPDKYPLVHRDLLRGIHLVTEPAAEALELGPMRHASFLHGAARLLSVLLAMATLWLVYRCGREIFGRRDPESRPASVLAALVTATLPPYVYYAKTANLEAPYLFWFTASLYFLLRSMRRQRLVDHVAFAVTAVLAIGSKDQAYGLYVATPLVLVWALHRRHVERGVEGRWRPWLRAVLDPRLALTGLVTVAGLALVYRLPTDPSWFWRHVEVITGPASDRYRVYPGTFAGQADMAWQSLRHLAFCFGVPLLACAVAGLWRLRRGWVLMLAAVSYYLSFIAVIGYNYVRFFLPVCILLSLPAGRVLARLWARGLPKIPRWTSRAVVAALLTLAALRGTAVDVLMLRDARYRAEQMLADSDGRALGLGKSTLLPRMETVPWRAVAKGGCRFLEQSEARFLVIHPVSLVDERVASSLFDGILGFRVASRFRQEPLFGLLAFEGLHVNLDKIARDVVVFERAGPCIDAEGLVGRLARLDEAEGGGKAEREALARLALDERIHGLHRLADDVVAFGLSSDRWMRPGQPAALVVGGGREGRSVELPVICAMPESRLPSEFRIDDGDRESVHVCRRRGVMEVELAPVAASEARLYRLHFDQWWQAPSSKRLLGIRIQPPEPQPPIY